MIPFIMNGNGTISIMLDGSMKPIDTAHRNYEAIKTALKEKNWDVIPSLVNIVEQIQEAIDNSSVESGTVVVKNGEVFWNDMAVHNTLTDRIINMSAEGFDIGHMIKFLENLMENPSFRAVNELYGFLEAGSIPITENGTFLAYKKIRADWKDIHSGTFDNSIGTVCKMPRNMVDENSEQTCSAGLHVCSYNYLPNFGSSTGDRVVICEINPRDVVAIPKDYNDTKMRCCEYKVIGEVTDYRDSNVLASKTVVTTSSVSSGNVVGVTGVTRTAKELGKAFTAALDDCDLETDTAVDLINEVMVGDVAEKIINHIQNGEDKQAGKALAYAIENGHLNASKFDKAFSDLMMEDEDLADLDEEHIECERCGAEMDALGGECDECGYHH